MTESPTIDDRSREELLETLRKRATNYTEEWDPHTEDAGTTLLYLFTRFGTDIINRLNDVPHKHRVAFLNALDFDRRPPQSARVPLTFRTTSDIDTNVVVSGGTQVTAETDDGETVIFEIPQDDGFEATPATLEQVYTVDPGDNAIYRHDGILDGAARVRLFSGDDLQNHEFYLGHEDLLNLEGGSTVTLTMGTASEEILDERVEWEYFGENEAGDPGWHPLPRETPDVIDDPFDDETALAEKMQRVSERIQLLGEDATDAGGENLYEPTFRLPGPTAGATVAGTESRWIRGTVPGDRPSDFEIEIDSVRLDIESGAVGAEKRRPTMVLSNDVPLSVGDGEFYPFGRMPQPPTTLYLASEEAFTKRGGAVTVQFVAPETEQGDETDAADEEGTRMTANLGGPLAGDPEISWEYWNGNGWTQLGLEADETDRLRTDGAVAFSVPDDFESTTVSGHDDYWIRARLVGGNYGQPQYNVTDEGARGELIQSPDPPVFSDITVSYGQRGAGFEHVHTHNNESYQAALSPEDERLTGDHEEPLAPFAGLPDETQTLYLGFDAPLREGPINLHIPLADKAYPRGFEPTIRWEYCTNPAGWNWEKLDVYDGTEGLTERGIVSVNFPAETTAFELFGTNQHWVRARITREEFVTEPATHTVPGDGGGAVEDGSAAPPADGEVPSPPTVEGIHPNTQWAYNERTVEETLGGSDGSPHQEFRCGNVPITEAAVWVDEAGSLSGSEQAELVENRPEEVRREETASGERFWVQWTEVDDFLDSDGSQRQYRLDRTNGTITFGDGQEGAIPPTGDGSIRAVYQTGGGSAGNVDAESVTDLRSSISRIDAVTNLRPSDGGTDTESLDQAVERAPKQIKNRGRAVTAEDFEQIATESSRQLAKVRCEPEMDGTGDRTPGWVTLLVIPRERRDRPTPSLELRQRVKTAVSERAPATLVGYDEKRIVVRGPDYAAVSVETTVDTEGVESVTNLKNEIEETLAAFFHPLTGGRDGDGWTFGSAPRLSQLTTLIESTEGVDRVQDIAMTIETTAAEKIIRDPGKTPVLSQDEMISSGTHDVSVIMRGKR